MVVRTNKQRRNINTESSDFIRLLSEPINQINRTKPGLEMRLINNKSVFRLVACSYNRNTFWHGAVQTRAAPKNTVITISNDALY